MAEFEIGESCEANAKYRPTMEDKTVIANSGTKKFIGVYDGHGGVHSVEYVSKRMHKELIKELILNERDPMNLIWKGVYRNIQNELKIQNETSSGTTAATVLLANNSETGKLMLYSANIGDTRSILINVDGSVRRITRDHVARDPEEIKKVQELNGFVLGGRVRGILAVSRAFGNLTIPGVSQEPYCEEHEILPGKHAYLVVACDGIWDVITDEFAALHVMDLYGKGTSVQSIAEQLVCCALERGSKDNISVVVVKF